MKPDGSYAMPGPDRRATLVGGLRCKENDHLIESGVCRVCGVEALPPAVKPTRTAEIALNDWILASPATRAVWGLDRRAGLWEIGLSVSVDGESFERLPRAKHADYATCVANAIEIARLAGYE